MTKRLLILFVSLGLLPHWYLLAQRIQSNGPTCNVVELTSDERQTLEKQVMLAFKAKQATNAAFSTITYVPIRPHVLRRSDGTGGISTANINYVIAITNRYYLFNGYGIQFYLAGDKPDYIDNTDQYNSFTDERALTRGHDVNNALNQYYINKFASGIGGYSYYPANNVQSTRSFVLHEPSGLDDMAHRLIPHELGHNFNLIHTFGNNNGTTGTSELVTRSEGANCSTDGDLVCDTPADPYNMSGAKLLYDGNGCPQYDPNSTARDAKGMAYTPSITNLMSYYFPCSHEFTTGQFERMQAALALRQTHTAYSLSYPPANAAAPGNLIASIVNGVVTLTWQDNATNEMGYFIERSTSPSSGFIPIAGVGTNETSFSDTKTLSNTTYYYRIKPSNNTTSGFSSIASVTTSTCQPRFTIGCREGDGLAGFTFNNVTLSQNSECSQGSYSSFTTTAAVTPGRSYTFTGSTLQSTYNQGVSIWADLNQNGTFEPTLGEIIYQTVVPASAGVFSGSITLPASLTAGFIPLRVTVNYNTIPSDACGIYTWGETEDYRLQVTGEAIADLSVSLISSTRIAQPNRPVSYSLTIRNDGPDDATGIRWENQLPPGLNFTSGSSDVTASANALYATSSLSLAAGKSITMTYQLHPSQLGTYRNAVQIISSDQTDPDSEPNSGTNDGQDDSATVDFRTTIAHDTLYTSPNSGQKPLPAAVTNQPLSDAGKADLSLKIASSCHVAVLNKPVNFTVSVYNAGGLEAKNIVVRDTLRGLEPMYSFAGVNIVSTSSEYTVLDIIIDAIPANEKVDFDFSAIVRNKNIARNAGQIWAVNVADPDSRPGSATPAPALFTGEDDEAGVDLRVISK
ncbi:hypothetical protein GCM10028807_56300 [Spirosoma daeguense]